MYTIFFKRIFNICLEKLEFLVEIDLPSTDPPPFPPRSSCIINCTNINGAGPDRAFSFYVEARNFNLCSCVYKGKRGHQLSSCHSFKIVAECLRLIMAVCLNGVPVDWQFSYLHHLSYHIYQNH